MAEGSASLFNNQRTGEWQTIPAGIVNSITASMSSALTPFLVSTRTKLTADATINVPADYATIQEAWDHICFDLDLAGFTVTIQLADGTHNGGLDDYPVDVANAGQNYIGGGYVILNGNPASPSNVIVTDTDDFTIRIAHSYLKVQNFEVRGTGCGIGAAWNGVIENGPGMRFGTCGTEQIHASSGGQIRFENDYSIVGNGGSHWFVHSQAQLRLGTITVTLVGVPNFTSAFYIGGTDGFLDAGAVTFSGTATGQQWFIDNNSMTGIGNGGDITVLPGSTTGNTNTAFQIDETRGPFPQVIASGSLSGNAVDITDIPLWVNRLTVHILNGSSNTAADYPKVQISVDNGATYITTGYTVSGVNLGPATASNTDSIISGFNGAAAADNWTLYGEIFGIQLGAYPFSTFTGFVNTISAVVIGGMGVYPGSNLKVDAIRIKLNGAASAFDGGTYIVIGSP